MGLEKLLMTFTLSPEAANEQIKETINQYKPLLYAVLQEGFGLFKDLVSNKEYFTQRAQFKRNMYEAYINSGFTEEEAMTLLIDSDIQKTKMLQQLVSSSGIKVNRE